jgi:hypothetical protein
MLASAGSDKEVEMTTLHHDPELYEPASRDDLYDLQGEIAELHERLDALLEAVEIIAHDHHRPLGLEGRVMGALHRARRRLAIYAADLRG